MAAEDLLRLAWEADHDGRHALRDALLTLAIVESRPGDDWPERCRARLVAERPGHYLGTYSSVRQALEDPRVIECRERLRRKYPAGRVGWLLLRAQAARGTFTGRVESLGAMIEDLAGLPAQAENVRLDAPEAVRGPRARARVARPVSLSPGLPSTRSRDDRGDAAVGWTPLPDPGEERAFPGNLDRRVHYVSIIFAIAMLLASLPADPDNRTIGE